MPKVTFEQIVSVVGSLPQAFREARDLFSKNNRISPPLPDTRRSASFISSIDASEPGAHRVYRKALEAGARNKRRATGGTTHHVAPEMIRAMRAVVNDQSSEDPGEVPDFVSRRIRRQIDAAISAFEQDERSIHDADYAKMVSVFDTEEQEEVWKWAAKIKEGPTHKITTNVDSGTWH